MRLNIGENIKKLRTLKNVTQEELADHLGISYQAVSRWEKGQCYPDIELIPEIANFFEIRLDELMCVEQTKDEINKILSKMSEITYMDNATALSTLRELQKQFPHNWSIKDALCSALAAGVDRKQFLGEEADYDEVFPEIRRYGWEARIKFDKDAVHSTQWLYRTMVLAAPDNEAEEWADQIVGGPYNFKQFDLFLRYRDYRKDPEKALYWQRELIEMYTGCLDNVFRPHDDSDEGWAHSAEMEVRLYDAIAGVPYKKNEIVYNTMYLSKRAEACASFFYFSAKAGNDEKAIFALKKTVDYLCLYADSLKQDRLTADNRFYNEDCEYTVHKKRYELLDWKYADLTRHRDVSQWTAHLKKLPEFKTEVERLRKKRDEVAVLYKDEIEKIKKENNYWFYREEEK